MKPLSCVLSGEKVEIVEIRGGRGLVTKLLNMGFYPGVKIAVVSNNGYGPLIVAKKEIRLGLGFGMAQKIFVKE
ncbi:ferrous iron transport protein A [bacterium]|nr:ferrous iron transport protein A [bacterium]